MSQYKNIFLVLWTFSQEKRLYLQFCSSIWDSNEGLSLLDDDEPRPISDLEELTELPLCHLDQLPLCGFLNKDLLTNVLESFALELSQPHRPNGVPGLLQISQPSCSEEDEGVPEPVTVPAELDLVKQGVGGDLVV